MSLGVGLGPHPPLSWGWVGETDAVQNITKIWHVHSLIVGLGRTRALFTETKRCSILYSDYKKLKTILKLYLF